MPHIDAAYLLSTPPGSPRRSRAASGLEVECVLTRAVYWLLYSTDPLTWVASFGQRIVRPVVDPLNAMISLARQLEECDVELQSCSCSLDEPAVDEADWVIQQWARTIRVFSVEEYSCNATESAVSAGRAVLRERSRIVRSLAVAEECSTIDDLLDCASYAVELELLRSVVERRFASPALVCPLPLHNRSVLERCFPGMLDAFDDSVLSRDEVVELRYELTRSIREIRHASVSPEQR